MQRVCYSTVDSISPAFGQGGTEVTITGTGLLADNQTVDSVTLATVGVAAVVSASATQIVVTAAVIENGQEQAGTAVITLGNDQTIESRALTTGSYVHQFTYKVPATISSVAPSQGQENTVVTIAGTELTLRPLEYRLLELFLSHPEEVLTRSQLLAGAWGITAQINTRTVDTHVRRLREALGSHADAIETIYGFGYRLRKP